MRTRLLKLSVFVLLCAAFGLYAFPVGANQSGPPFSRTGAPALGNFTAELTCNTSDCHTGNALNANGGTLTITGFPDNYTPGQEYTVTVTMNRANRAAFGFQATVLTDAGQRAGDLATSDARTLVGLQTSGSYAGRQYIEHTFAGSSPNGTNQGSWNFKWKAPASAVGRITIYVAANAANGSGTQAGDFIYTTSKSAQPAAALSALASVSAASYAAPPLAAESISAAFGTSLAQNTTLASTTPLPTQLDGTEVEVKDSLNVARNASLFFVSAGQVNYLIPSGTATGAATVTLKRNGTATAQGIVNIDTVAPALFAANNNGVGVPAAVLFRRRNNVDTFESIATFNSATNKFEATPIDLGPSGDLVILILFGTGFRNNTNLSAVTATLGGADAPVGFAGAAPGFVGLDQANVTIPRSLIGRGTVDLVFNVAGKTANTLQVNIK